MTELAAKARPLQIAMVTPPLESSGGIGRLTGYLRQAWQDDDHFDVHLVDSRGDGGSARSLVAVARACGRLDALRRGNGLDGVHINLASRGSALRKTLIMAHCRWRKVPYAVTLHGGRFGEWLSKLPSIGRWWVRWSLQHSAAFIATGERWKLFAEEQLHVDPHRIWLIPNSTPDPGTPKLIRRDNDEPLVTVFAGDLVEFKGIFRLVEALGRLAAEGRSIRLEIAGRGDDEGVRIALDAAGIRAHTTMHGWLDQERMSALLSAGHVLVLPSRVENQPMSVIEAMAHGLPVVSTLAGTIPELVENGETGWLIDADDVEALTERIERMFDETERETMALAARERWERLFTVERQWLSTSTCWYRVFGRA